MRKKIIVSISVILVLVLAFFAYLYFKPLNIRTTDYTPNPNFSYTFHEQSTYNNLLDIVSEYNSYYDYNNPNEICIGRGNKQMKFMSFDKKRITINFASLMYCADSDKFLLEQLLYLHGLAAQNTITATENGVLSYMLFNSALMFEDKNYKSLTNFMGEVMQEYMQNVEE